ncbi:hypothetical protein [Cellulomonas shaoxiangyii]|uniref:Lipocalin-like domain-containing protein n=1 Tax=Cellulomonas shaoxiangyii TaxID=2566013 RepID=A0A4P7SH16_9CELL|nr:hypothetical protein [Cellulomonas shaoxiangyii]QCB92807.1 hypothetical protein E5225_03820 [Cellulomonas shaoxiangyii]TGY83192.1 hypothetical protein E5226_12485 [Cellulomonas shaoxiangyii]
MRRPLALAATAATALLLTTACTGGGDDPAPTASGSSASSTPSAEETGDAEETPDAGAAAGGDLQECILGTWNVDTAAMQEAMTELLAIGEEEVGDLQMSVTGDGTYDFAEGGAFSSTANMSSGVTIAAEGMEIVTESTSTGTMTGSWTLEGDQLTLADIDTSGLTVTTSGSMNGEPLEIPEGSTEAGMEAAPPTASTVTCTDDTLTLTTTSAVDESSEPVSLSYTLRR